MRQAQVEVEVEVGVEVGVEVEVAVGVDVVVEVGGRVWGWAYFFGRMGGWVGGWLEIWRVKLISTQVVVEVEVGVELGNTRKIYLETPLDVLIDGPFGSSSSNIYEAEHAVLIGTGIGVTPFSSILQSIMHRYRAIKQTCPNCKYQLTPHIQDKSFKLKKVDFFWINRNQKSFEWFVHLLSQLETEQEEHGGALGRFLEMHMYVTSALHKTDMKSVALQLALDILYEKEHRDLVTGLKTRTNAGRPDWDKVFTKLKQEKRGQVTIFFCGNQVLGRVLRYKCEEFGFKFKKEVF